MIEPLWAGPLRRHNSEGHPSLRDQENPWTIASGEAIPYQVIDQGPDPARPSALCRQFRISARSTLDPQWPQAPGVLLKQSEVSPRIRRNDTMTQPPCRGAAHNQQPEVMSAPFHDRPHLVLFLPAPERCEPLVAELREKLDQSAAAAVKHAFPHNQSRAPDSGAPAPSIF